MAWMTILGLDWVGGRFEHPFDIVNVPHRPGVFKLHARLTNGEWEVFYVGQAANLYAALLSCLSDEADPCVRQRLLSSETAYSYAEVADERDRLGCLRSLYAYYGPACNPSSSIPDITDISCNPY